MTVELTETVPRGFRTAIADSFLDVDVNLLRCI